MESLECFLDSFLIIQVNYVAAWYSITERALALLNLLGLEELSMLPSEHTQCSSTKTNYRYGYGQVSDYIHGACILGLANISQLPRSVNGSIECKVQKEAEDSTAKVN